MTPRYELFDHTADIGVRAWAPSLPQLVQPSTDGFYAVIGELATTGEPVAWRFELTGDDPALLLRDYLAEVLHLFDNQQRRLTDIRVRDFTPERLVVAGQARPIDGPRSAFEREAKAVTYHELAIRPIADGFEATYIVDV